MTTSESMRFFELKYLVSSLFGTVCGFFLFNLAANAQFYVSPSGNDGGDGTILDPWRTLAGARDNIRPLLDGTGHITVFLRGGTYILTNTVVFGTEDSGTANQIITYRAFSNETPVISSLIQVTGWTNHDQNIVRAPLPMGIGHVRYLQDASEDWMPRSATVSFNTSEVAGGEDNGCVECNWDLPATQPDRKNIQYPVGFIPPNPSKATQYDLRETVLGWNMEILPIESINTISRRILTTIPACFDMRWDQNEAMPTAWVLNSLEGIDQPGEWACLDNTIYLYPSSGTNDIFVPLLTELVRVDEGTADGNGALASNPVSHLVFDGLTFTGGDFYTMISTEPASARSAEVTSQHDWAVVDKPDALLRLRNVSDITVRNCTFAKSGGTGLRVDRHGQNILVENNLLEFLGRNGACFIGRGPGYGDVNRNNRIWNNHFERTGMEKWASPALILDQSSSNHVYRNYFANTYFTAMAVVGPRQIMLAAYAEEAGVGPYLGREFHFYQVGSNVISFIQDAEEPEEATEPAMAFIYNYDNVIEENAFIDVDEGQGVFFNGKACYISGVKKGQTNTFSYNYIYDSFDHSHNDYAWYNDNDQDACVCVGNMIHNVTSGGAQPEPFPLIQVTAGWAETDSPGTGAILLQANASLNCTFLTHVNGSDFIEVGTIRDGVGGDMAYVSDYERMWSVLCPGNIANATLPGAEAMQTMLAGQITNLLGSISGCVFPAISIREASLEDDTVTVEFTGPAFYADWNVASSSDLIPFTDVTPRSIITETGARYL